MLRIWLSRPLRRPPPIRRNTNLYHRHCRMRSIHRRAVIPRSLSSGLSGDITRTRKICTDSWSYGLRQHAIAVDAITVQRQGDTSPISLTIAFTLASPAFQATQDCAAIDGIRVDNYCAVDAFAPGMSLRSTGYQYIGALPGAEGHYYSLVALRVLAHDGAVFCSNFLASPTPGRACSGYYSSYESS